MFNRSQAVKFEDGVIGSSQRWPDLPHPSELANAICDTCGKLEWSPKTGQRHWCIPRWTHKAADELTE